MMTHKSQCENFCLSSLQKAAATAIEEAPSRGLQGDVTHELQEYAFAAIDDSPRELETKRKKKVRRWHPQKYKKTKHYGKSKAVSTTIPWKNIILTNYDVL